jgi:catechol 2,3-dioxygenase-like lactoylglutathione lyase family enzyme
MDEAVATNAPWEIMGARHGGITVSSLDRSLEFYVGLVGLELVWRREYVNDEIREIVGISDATSVDIAMLDIPGGGAQVELLEYKGCERTSGSHPPCDFGTGHFCVFVRNIEACHAELAAQGVRFRSDGPVEMLEGPNTGGKSLYGIDPDGYIFEFHERPPHVGA